MFNPARPYFYLLAYIAIVYLRPQEYVPALLESPLVPVSLLIAAVFWLFAQPRNFEAPQHALLVGLLFAIFLSVLMTGWLTGAANAFMDFLPTMLLFYMVATSVDSLKRFREMAIVLTILSVVMAYHGIDQAASETGIGWTGAKTIEGRITYLGFLSDPNDLSMVFLMTLPFALYLSKVSSSFIFRLAYLAAAGVILYGVYLCNSRGSVLGLASMLFVYGVHRYGWVRSLIVVPLMLGPLLVLGPSRMNEMSADEESAAGRIDAWYEGFDMLRSHPIFGVGKGLFGEHNGNLTAHNSFVLAIAELGVFGYFFWLSIVFVSGVMLYRILRSEEPPPSVAMPSNRQPPVAPWSPAPPREPPLQWPDLQLVASTLAYASIGSLVAAFFLSRSYVVFLYLLMALIVAVYQMTRARWPTFAPVRFGDLVGKVVLLEFGSIVFLWLLTAVLLSMS